jgi:choline dehydrogenase-like flavoprotein
VHPGLVGALAPWRDAAAFAALLRALPHVVGVGAIVRDRDGGEVRVTRAGAPVVRYRLSDHDRASARRGVEGAAAILEAAGAHTIATCHATAPSYRPGRDGDRARLMADADRCGFEAGRHGYVSFHALGSARLGGRPESSAADPEGELWGVRGVHVCDAAALPSAPGVNPMLAIAATAHLTASALAARLT